LTILTYAERQKQWNWCREFIDREAIYRADEIHPLIPGKFGGHYGWQFYLRRATLNPPRLAVLGPFPAGVLATPTLAETASLFGKKQRTFDEASII
jgi:hypothetical protein